MFLKRPPKHSSGRLAGGVAILGAMLSLGSAQAADTQAADAQAADAQAAGAQATSKDDLWHRDTLTGNWFGFGDKLSDKGISLSATETSEFLSDVSGGLKRGSAFDGRLEMDLDLDLAKLAGWQGATIHASAYQIHGRGLSGNYTGNILDVSNIEAERTTRLFDLYLEQSLMGGKLSVRLGQIAADDEFITSSTAGTFINGAFGWPGITAADLPSGGPAYPLATPGVRVRYNFSDQLSWQTAVMNGNPGGDTYAADGQAHDANGLAFPLNQGVFVITEGSWSRAGDKDKGVLPATYKLGAWYDSQPFADQRFDQNGVSLASPASNGIPRNHNGDWGIYGVVDRMLYRVPGTDDHGLSAFLRLAGSPSPQNLVSFYADGGLTWKAPFASRGDDTVGLAVAWAEISNRAADLDRDTNFFNGTNAPVRDREIAIEATYQAQVAPWLVVQPDLQYIVHPGGNIADPNDPAGTKAVEDAVVVGVRSVVKF
ncbi:MAG TPA: carbohydrate porin [Stellaceae bacterium]|jgi:porin|nr:carbohydrate porin [Stellaceae bacterium]